MPDQYPLKQTDDDVGLQELTPTGMELELRAGWFRGPRNTLSNRSEDTLEELDLSNTIAGDIDLVEFVLALAKCGNLRFLLLSNNGIGRRGCTSLSGLLESQASNLQYLYLSQNAILSNSIESPLHRGRPCWNCIKTKVVHDSSSVL